MKGLTLETYNTPPPGQPGEQRRKPQMNTKPFLKAITDRSPERQELATAIAERDQK
jgi:hypothetical protein